MTSQTLPTSPAGDDVAARRQWMRTLAMADPGVLDAAWQGWAPKPAVQAIRGPEAGIVMVRARMDGGGARFNLGEATVSRATVRLHWPPEHGPSEHGPSEHGPSEHGPSEHGAPLAEDAVGTSYLLGTDLEHARLAAIFDGLLSDAGQRDRVLAEVIAPLERAQAERDAARNAEARSTLVNFFTVSREHE